MLLNNDEWIALIERLIAVTEKRSLEWETNRSDDATEEAFWYRAQVGDVGYSVGAVDGDGVAPFFIEIWRGARIYDSVQSPAGRGSEDQLTLRNSLRDLHREIGRAVNKAPEQVASLMDGLANLG